MIEFFKEDLDWFGRIGMVFFLLAIAAFVWVVIWAGFRMVEMNDYENKCNEAHGIMVKNTCMDPSSVLKLK